MFHFVIEEPRARRRRVSSTIAHRRRAQNRARNFGSDLAPGIRETSDTYFSKKSPYGCGCRKRKKGQPKVACGMCDIGQRDRIIHWRQEARAVREGRFEVERIPSSAKATPKVFLVEKQDVSRDGTPCGGWWVYRKYRTAKGRDSAISALRKGTRKYEIRNYHAGDEGVYVGPVCVYRAG